MKKVRRLVWQGCKGRSKQRFGLVGIRERLLHSGGQLIIKSTPGQGTRFVMIVPWTLGHNT